MSVIAAVTEMPINRVLHALADCSVQAAGADRWKARCPAHEDRKASLAISIGAGGKALLNCFAGCKTDDVAAAVGLEMRDLMPPRDVRPALKKKTPVRRNAVRLRAVSRSRRLARVVGHLDLHGPGIASVRSSGRQHQPCEEFAHRV